MRIAGVTLTVFALIAVQAPWIVCACEDSPSCAPILFGTLAHAEGEPARDDACCDAAAHLAHGAAHRHKCSNHDHAHNHAQRGRHCHGGYTHAHQQSEAPSEPEPSEHVGFRLPIATLPADVDLDPPAVTHVLPILILETTPFAANDGAVFARSLDPPESISIPAGSSERLLL